MPRSLAIWAIVSPELFASRTASARNSWPTKADPRAAIFEWIDVFYNRQRLHATLGNYAPEEFETISLNQLKEAA